MTMTAEERAVQAAKAAREYLDSKLWNIPEWACIHGKVKDVFARVFASYQSLLKSEVADLRQRLEAAEGRVRELEADLHGWKMLHDETYDGDGP